MTVMQLWMLLMAVSSIKLTFCSYHLVNNYSFLEDSWACRYCDFARDNNPQYLMDVSPWSPGVSFSVHY